MLTSTAKKSVGRRSTRRAAARVSTAVLSLAFGLGWVATTPASAAPNERPVHVEGQILSVEKAPKNYRVTGAFVGTYNLRSERTIHTWTYFGAQIRATEGTGSIIGCLDRDQNQACGAGEPLSELRLTFNRVASFDTRSDRLIEGLRIHQVLRNGSIGSGVLTMRDIRVGDSDEILSTYAGDLLVKKTAGGQPAKSGR